MLQVSKVLVRDVLVRRVRITPHQRAVAHLAGQLSDTLDLMETRTGPRYRKTKASLGTFRIRSPLERRQRCVYVLPKKGPCYQPVELIPPGGGRATTAMADMDDYQVSAGNDSSTQGCL